MIPWAREDDRRHGAVFGMWVFLGSESLLFAGLFAVYAAYRADYPEMFAKGCHDTTLVVGTLGTFVLLFGSLFAALAAELDRKRLLFVTSVTAVVFLALKIGEYAQHVHDGLVPGHDLFWTLYWLMTGLHAVHVTIGGFAVTASGIWARRPQHVETVANYWHLVDVIWLFLWPMFYLMRGGG